MMSIVSLIGLLEEMTDIHVELLEIGELKRQAIISNNVNQLNMMVVKESRFARKLEGLEQARVQCIKQFLQEKGYLPTLTLTVTDVMKLVFSVEERRNLEQARDKLLAATDSLKRLTQLNRTLVEQSLVYINYSLDLLAGPPDNDMFYSNPQQPPVGLKRPGLFDTRG